MKFYVKIMYLSFRFEFIYYLKYYVYTYKGKHIQETSYIVSVFSSIRINVNKPYVDDVKFDKGRIESVFQVQLGGVSANYALKKFTNLLRRSETLTESQYSN